MKKKVNKRNKILELVDAGWGRDAIASRVNCSKPYVYNVVTKRNKEVKALKVADKKTKKGEVGLPEVKIVVDLGPPSTRAVILDTAKSHVTKDRATSYGKAENSFGTIASYWSVHLGVEVTATDVAVMMSLLKIARVKNNPKHMDNWVDLAGYAACGGEVANGDS